MPEPGQQIRLPPAVEDHLSGALSEWITQLENDNRDLYSNITTYWNWYDARPLHKTRTEPWHGASNVVVPIIPTMVDGVTARLWGQLHTPTRTWMLRSDNETLTDMRSAISEFMNREARSTFDIQSVTYDWIQECVVVGSSVLWVTWGRKLANRWDPTTRRVKTYQVSNGPIVEHVPREFIIWERDKLLQDSSTVVRQRLCSWSDLIYYKQCAGWDIDDCQGYEGIDGPSGGVLAERRRLEGVNEGRGYSEPHDIREVWIDYPMAQLLASRDGVRPRELDDPDYEQTPIVITYHRKARKILRIVAHPYYIHRWPGADIYFRRVSGRTYSPGLAKRLEHTQRATTTLLNQTIDGITLANTMKWFTQDPAHRNMKFNPFQPIFTTNIADIRDVRMNQQVLPDIQVINLMLMFAERIAGLSDPNFGRESRMGGHPSPATNILVQLQEGAKLLGTTLKNIRAQLSTVGEWIFNLYQQHETPGNPRIAAALGPKDALDVDRVLATPGALQWDLHALSEATNPDAERNNAVAVTQLTGNYYAFVLRMLTLADSKDPRVGQTTKAAAMRAIDAMTKSYTSFLEASDIDDPDQYALKLREAMNASVQSIGQFPAEPLALGGGGAPGGAASPLQQRSVVSDVLGAGADVPTAAGSNVLGY